MISLTGQLSPPQVFFNDTYIGGAAQTIAVLNEWDRDLPFFPYNSPRERYEVEIRAAAPPTDCRLFSPRTIRVINFKKWPVMKHCSEIILPDGSSMSAIEVTKKLMATLPRKKRFHKMELLRDYFTGADGVSALTKCFQIESREAATRFGQNLLHRGVLHQIGGKQRNFDDSSSYLYRLQPFHEPCVLNSFVLWRRDDGREVLDPNPIKAIAELSDTVDSIILSATDGATGLVDYSAARRSDLFAKFEEDACVLQTADLARMDVRTKLAFGINLYNLMIKHGLIKLHEGRRLIDRQLSPAFYDAVRYRLWGGHVLTASDLEHGVLRANSPRAGHSSRGGAPPFSPSDPRRSMALPAKDRRIHFALHRGTRGSPPVVAFTAEAIDEELQVVTERYCDREENVTICERDNRLVLPREICWYLADFRSSKSELPRILLPFLRGERRERLERMLKADAKIEIRFRDYDWTTNAMSGARLRDGTKSTVASPKEMSPARVPLRPIVQTPSPTKNHPPVKQAQSKSRRNVFKKLAYDWRTLSDGTGIDDDTVTSPQSSEVGHCVMSPWSCCASPDSWIEDTFSNLESAHLSDGDSNVG